MNIFVLLNHPAGAVGPRQQSPENYRRICMIKFMPIDYWWGLNDAISRLIN